jgi:mannose-6-phosphate isomerase-like protein (cupin superfamily)
MEYIKSSDGIKRKNSDTCMVTEYTFEGEKSINSAVIELSGRYPDYGFAFNTVCEEIVYVIEGEGRLSGSDSEMMLGIGDMLRIKPQVRDYFEGRMKLLISSSPAWYPEQYQNLSVV